MIEQDPEFHNPDSQEPTPLRNILDSLVDADMAPYDDELPAAPTAERQVLDNVELSILKDERAELERYAARGIYADPSRIQHISRRINQIETGLPPEQ